MKWFVRALCLVVVSASAIGCVSQSQYDSLRTAYLREKEQNVDMQARLEEALARANALRSAQTGPDADLEGRLAQALQDKARLDAALAEMEQRLRAAGMDTQIALPAELDRALRQLAEQHPGLMTYDARRGMVKLSSDLTFDLGSAQVKPSVRGALAQLAQVIAGQSGSQFEAWVVGHTDNVPIRRADTLAKHPTNWHLSAHRAISVMDVIRSSGVSANRFMVGGYGEYRPVVPNGARGAEANRRVEIFLVASTAGAAAVDSAQSPPVAPPMQDEAPRRTPTADEPPVMFK